MQEQQEKQKNEIIGTSGGRTIYCVEYYSDVIGNGVRKFEDPLDRDMWLIGISVDQFYLYEEDRNENRS